MADFIPGLILEYVKEYKSCPDCESLARFVNDRYHTGEYGLTVVHFRSSQEIVESHIENIEELKLIFVGGEGVKLTVQGEFALEHVKKHMQPWRPLPDVP